MKTILKIIDRQRHVKRLPEKEAELLVKNEAWHFVPKPVWKRRTNHKRYNYAY